MIIAAYSKRLSRMFLWDMKADKFTGGQWLKARATIEDVSPDGRYVSYEVDARHKPEGCYMGVSKPPFFTALAFYPVSPNWLQYARFPKGDVLELCGSARHSWMGTLIEERVDSGCPFRIIRGKAQNVLNRVEAFDELHNRWLRSEGENLVEISSNGERTLLRQFSKEDFKLMVPPEWASK